MTHPRDPLPALPSPAMGDGAVPLGRNDRRILDLVCRANGGGVSLVDEPHAPVQRLIKRGLIQRKSHTYRGNQPWVHTQMGWLVWKTEQ